MADTPYDPNQDPAIKKPPVQAISGPMVNSTLSTPNTGVTGQTQPVGAPVPETQPKQATLGNPGDTSTQPQPAPAAPQVGGSADFPSLPVGATPPPGYVDPVTHKVAGPAGSASSSPAAPTSTVPTGPPQTVNDAYKQALFKGLTSQAPTDINSNPVLKAQSDAYAVQQQRAADKARQAFAERRAATGVAGTEGGGFDSDLAGLLQQQGENVGNYNAGLLGTAAKDQADQLRQYMALYSQDMNAEQQREAQRQLAELDAQVRREGIQSQASLGQGDLALRARLGDQNALLQLMQIQNQAGQFDKRLGFDTSTFNAARDDSNFWKALGGLG